MQDFLDVAEAVTEHLSIQLDNPSIGLDEQVFLSINKVIWNDNRFRTDYLLGLYIFWLFLQLSSSLVDSFAFKQILYVMSVHMYLTICTKFDEALLLAFH